MDSIESNMSCTHCSLIRVIGFRRVPPTAGRKLNFVKDIMELEDSRNATGITYINEGTKVRCHSRLRVNIVTSLCWGRHNNFDVLGFELLFITSIYATRGT